MVEIRDKGPVPLDHADPKIVTFEDAKTGFLCIVALDLNKKQFALWWQPQGWIAARESYGNVDLTGWQLVVHDGAAKLVAETWAETSPDKQAHEDILVLRQLY